MTRSVSLTYSGNKLVKENLRESGIGKDKLTEALLQWILYN